MKVESVEKRYTNIWGEKTRADNQMLGISVEKPFSYTLQSEPHESRGLLMLPHRR